MMITTIIINNIIFVVRNYIWHVLLVLLEPNFVEKIKWQHCCWLWFSIREYHFKEQCWWWGGGGKWHCILYWQERHDEEVGWWWWWWWRAITSTFVEGNSSHGWRGWSWAQKIFCDVMVRQRSGKGRGVVTDGLGVMPSGLLVSTYTTIRQSVPGS